MPTFLMTAIRLSLEMATSNPRFIVLENKYVGSHKRNVVLLKSGETTFELLMFVYIWLQTGLRWSEMNAE